MNPELPPIDTNSMLRVRGQLGSNPAGIYRDDRGRDYYVKNLESRMHARNEWLAAKLYQLAGAPILTYVSSKEPTQIATQWVELDKKSIASFTESERLQAQQWFAVHAWTANWDAAGYNGDNQGVANGVVLTLDVGGALAFRAYGDPKGKAFGTSVEELNVMRNDPLNRHAVKLFADITPNDLHRAIHVVTDIPDEKIRNVIIENGGSQRLADKMIARKEDMIRRFQELSRPPAT